MKILADKIVDLFEGFGLLPRDMTKDDVVNLRNAKHELVKLLSESLQLKAVIIQKKDDEGNEFEETIRVGDTVIVGGTLKSEITITGIEEVLSLRTYKYACISDGKL